MKKTILILMLAAISESSVHAQWQKQTSPTTSTLNDVYFADAKRGMAVGAKGTIIKTSNGGASWQLMNSPTSDDLVSVYMADSLNVFMTSAGTSGSSAVYKSVNGGQSWTKSLSDLQPFYITGTPNGKLFSESRSIYESSNLGTGWTNRALINSTSVYTHISFADNNTGMAVGNISGILNYSTDFMRSEDGGRTWYRGYPFSFPNDNSFTAMNSLNADSVFMFTNFPKVFQEGDTSQLILMTGFKLAIHGGPEEYEFKSTIVVKKFADKIRDCKFFTSRVAYAAGDKGIIYASKDGGKNWKADYKGNTSLKALFMFNEGRGFAVGDKGLILKRSLPEPIEQKQNAGKIFPVIEAVE